MKKVFKKINIVYYILFSVVIILFIFLFFEERNIDIFLKIITPIITLFTGVIIFYSFKESQKPYKYQISKELYSDFIEKLDAHITDIKIEFDAHYFKKHNLYGEHEDKSHFRILTDSNTINWHEKLMRLLESVKRDQSFIDVIEQNKIGKITPENFENFDYAYLPDQVDILLDRVKKYYEFLQTHLYNLLNNEYDDFVSIHRIFLIDKIIKETKYNNFFFLVESYFNVNDNAEIELTKTSESDNISVLEKGLEKKSSGKAGFVISKRDLIRWEVFSELVARHHDVLSLSKKIREEDK